MSAVVAMPIYPKDGIDITATRNIDTDGFLKGHLHQHIILGGTFPFCGLISDSVKCRNILIKHLCFDNCMDIQSFNIFYALLNIARAELTLKIKINIHEDDEMPLMYFSGMNVTAKTFHNYLKPLVTMVESSTQRNLVTQESFKGQYFMYVRARRSNKTTFYLNYMKLNELGKLLGFLPYNDIDGSKKGKKTQLNGVVG